MDIVKAVERELSNLDVNYAENWVRSFTTNYRGDDVIRDLTIFWHRELSHYGFSTIDGVKFLRADEPPAVWLRNFKDDVIPLIKRKLNEVYACRTHWSIAV